MQLSLVKEVRSMRTLGRAWSVVFENGRSSRSTETRREVDKFASAAIPKLTKIQRQLNRDAFTFKLATGVPVREKGKKKIRPLVVAPIESRIVQRAIHDVLLGVPAILQYAENPYSFGGVRKQLGKDLGAVPAAIEAVLAGIKNGATYVIRSDISSFFTRISKPTVCAIVDGATHEPKFLELFRDAIKVELENLASLREHAGAFPIAEIGVAQGCSLSPLLGNLALSDFDR
jgi:RNA-directed DNA polymerase